MNEHYKGTPAKEPFPEVLERFMKNNPSVKQDSLYLCESVDIDGNIIDTKIGVNLMTNYGLSRRFVNGIDDNKNIWLGSGRSEPNPALSQLTTYISSLGQGSSREDYDTYWEPTYDRDTKIWTSRRKVSRMYWDYTTGDNNEYEIWEIGVGDTQTTLLTHALIYDEHGDQTCIVKRPNTKLYITIYWTNSVSVAPIPQMYNDGKYVLLDPSFQNLDGNWKGIYWGFLSRGRQYGYTDSGLVLGWYDIYNRLGTCWNSYSTDDKCETIAGDPREASYDKGVVFDRFFEKPYWYISGVYVSDTYWDNDKQSSIHSAGAFACLSFEQIDVPEVMETDWAYVNASPFKQIITADNSYTGNELEDLSLRRLDNLFGYTHDYFIDNPKAENQQNWKYPRGMLPCTDFDISELTMYNYLTKEWDIDVPFLSYPDTIYCQAWQYMYLEISMNYNGTIQDVYVYVNMESHKPISSFDNTGMTIAATDEYWDPTTYVEIPNLANIPTGLQRKRYYIVVAGTNAALNPQYKESECRFHRINPTNEPWEITHDTTGVLHKVCLTTTNNGYTYLKGGVEQTRAENYRSFGQPLISADKGYFVIGYMLVFLDKNKNCTRYNLLLDNNCDMDKNRRWITEHGEKIVMFTSRVSYKITNDTIGSSVITSYADAANTFSVWTVTDSTTAPTREDVTLVWNDATIVNNNTCYHQYSWSNKGYLVVAKRRTEPEFIYVNVFEEGMPQHLITDAKHCHVIENTTICCYQDMALSTGTTYVFKLYDMANEEIINTVTISDGSTYTIIGIYGYNNHLYIHVKDSSNIEYTYYYGIDSGYLERILDYFYMADSEAPFVSYRTVIFEDTCFSIVESDRESDLYDPVVISGNKWHKLFNETTTNKYSRSYLRYPNINVMNNGKQPIMCVSAAADWAVSVIDVGELMDSPNKQIDHYPYEYYHMKSTGSVMYMGGVLIPFNDGIIMVCGGPTNNYNDTNQIGRMWWLPLEMCIKMHMKGTTRTLNSYNAPVSFSLTKKLQYRLTNDLSRLLPNNGG